MQNLSKFSKLLPETCWPQTRQRVERSLKRQAISSGPAIMGYPSLKEMLEDLMTISNYPETL